MARPTTAVDAILKVPHLRSSFDRENRRESTLKLINQVRPSWQSTSGEIDIEQLEGGVMNTLFKITKQGSEVPQEKVEETAILMRVYGLNTDQLVNREVEANVHAQLAHMNLAAPLLARFENGLLYQFIPGKVCDAKDLGEEGIWKAVASILGEWHARLSPTLPSKKEDSIPNGTSSSLPNGTEATIAECIRASESSPNVWTEMLEWVSILPAATEEQIARKKTLQAELEQSFVDLESGLQNRTARYVVGHNDLLSANVVVHARQDSKQSLPRITFIDYEYAKPCPAAFDLANHFAEWGGFECNYNMLPSRQTRRAFIKQYLQSYNRHAQIEGEISDQQIEKFLSDVDRYRGIPGFRWSLHAMVEEFITEIDFDWAGYAKLRLAEYWDWRKEEDGSRKTSGEEMPLRERMWAREI